MIKNMLYGLLLFFTFSAFSAVPMVCYSDNISMPYTLNTPYTISAPYIISTLGDALQNSTSTAPFIQGENNSLSQHFTLLRAIICFSLLNLYRITNYKSSNNGSFMPVPETILWGLSSLCLLENTDSLFSAIAFAVYTMAYTYIFAENVSPVATNTFLKNPEPVLPLLMPPFEDLIVATPVTVNELVNVVPNALPDLTGLIVEPLIIQQLAAQTRELVTIHANSLPESFLDDKELSTSTSSLETLSDSSRSALLKKLVIITSIAALAGIALRWMRSKQLADIPKTLNRQKIIIDKDTGVISKEEITGNPLDQGIFPARPA